MGGIGALGGVSAVGGIFVPQLSIQLDSALIWLKANTLTGADGSAVTTWANDGTGEDFTQATSGNKPTLQTAEQNGLSVVRFDGTDDFLSSAAGMSLTQPCMFYGVASRTGNLTASSVLVTQTTEAIAAGFDVTSGEWYTYTNPALVDQAAANSAFHVLACFYNEAGVGTSLMYMDSLTGAGKTLDAGNVSADTFHVGATAAAASPLAGDIAELLMFQGTHTVAQRNLVINYLATKWGVTLS
jgi:hypothetical protein